MFDWPSETVGRTWTHAHLNGRDPADPYISPAHGDLRGLPPLLVQVGGADLLRDQGIAIAERAKASGVDARLVIEPDMVHDWHTFAGVFAHCARAIDDAGAFVREATRT